MSAFDLSRAALGLTMALTACPVLAQSSSEDFASLQQAYAGDEAYDLSMMDFVHMSTENDEGGLIPMFTGMIGGRCYAADAPTSPANGALVITVDDAVTGVQVANVSEVETASGPTPAGYFDDGDYDPTTLDTDLPFLARASIVKDNSPPNQVENGSDMPRQNIGLRVRLYRQAYLGKIIALQTQGTVTAGEVLAYCHYTTPIPAIQRSSGDDGGLFFKARQEGYVPCGCPQGCR